MFRMINRQSKWYMQVIFQIFKDEMYEIMIDYLQLGFGHDVFII